MASQQPSDSPLKAGSVEPLAIPLEKAEIENQVGHSSEWYKLRKLFFAVLVIWLVSLPVTAVIQFVVQFVLSGSGNSGFEPIKLVINILSLIAGIIGVLGWIPVTALGILWSQKK